MNSPQFDVTGVWKTSEGQTVQFFQEKDHVTGIYVNAAFAHSLEGRYVSSTKIKLIQIRRTRAGGCEMTMTLDMNVNTAMSITVAGVATETACGLTAGNAYPDQLTRVL